MTELYIEGNRVDLSSDISALLTFAIDDVKDFGARNTTFSKTIVLPGTSNNNKLFGHIFDVTQANPYNPALPNVATNFNAAKSANAIMFQDNMQVFKGVLRLLEVISDRGVIEYEVAVFGELGGFITALGNKKLEDLDFSAYNHDYTLANITASWDTAGAGQGYIYPLIDYGNYSVNKHDWDYKTFRPALFVREYLQKIFQETNYSYDFPLIDTARFKSLVIPHNQSKLRGATPSLAAFTIPNQTTIDKPDASEPLLFGSISSADFTLIDAGKTIKYNGSSPILGDIFIEIKGEYYASDAVTVSLDSSTQALPLVSTELNGTGGTTFVPFTFTLQLTGRTFNNGETYALDFNTSYDPDVFTQFHVEVFNTSTFKILAANGQNAELNLGNPLDINAILPKNVLQRDFFSSILKLFNLYVYEDKFESRKLVVTPYIDFYDTDPANFLDWTYKLNRDKPVRLKPMSELNSRYYEFKFKDDSDYYNDLYKKRYNEGYGSRLFDSEFEFAGEKATVELIFAGTPLVGYQGEEKVYSTIFKRTGTSTIVEENADSVIRLLQVKKVTGVASWDIKNGSTVLGSYTDYCYAGHLDDPDAPANDIQFGVPKELFFELTAGAINVNQFNVYYSDYMAEITDPKSLLLTASFYLNPKDIYNLDFSKLIYIDGALFRLNKIEDYNASYPDECKATLLKVIYAGIDGVSGSSFPLSFPVTLGG